MAVINTNNNGSVFYSSSYGKSFNQYISASLRPLSSFPATEVVLVNVGDAPVLIYDNNNFLDANSLMLSAGNTFTIKGITNANQISAKTIDNQTSSSLYYRATI